jgi:hypothetical protein
MFAACRQLGEKPNAFNRIVKKETSAKMILKVI